MWSILNLIMRISMGSRKICWPTIIRLEFSVVNIPQVEYWSSPCWWQVFYFTLWIEWRWHVSHWRSWCGILASKVPNWQGMSKVVVFSRVKGSHTLLKCELRRDHDVLWRHSVLSSVETLDLFFFFFLVVCLFGCCFCFVSFSAFRSKWFQARWPVIQRIWNFWLWSMPGTRRWAWASDNQRYRIQYNIVI